jgi:hypothetical protein
MYLLRIPNAYTVGVLACELDFFSANRANAQLQRLFHRAILDQTPHNTGMAIGRTLILIAQVGVRVKLHQRDRPAQGLRQAAAKAHTNRMLPAQPHHELACRCRLIGGFGYGIHRGL